MATLITKNSSTAASVPGTGDLVQGELAVNVADKRLFTKNSGGSVVEVGTNPSSLNVDGDYTEKVNTANTGTAYTIALTAGTIQILTLTGNCTFTFPTPTAGKSFMILLKQDGTGSRLATWPASVKWPAGASPLLTTTASRMDKFIFTADGTNWYGSNGGQNYTV
jgi:hypothetical protein